MNKIISMYIAAELWINDKMNTMFRKEDGAVDIVAIVVLIGIAVVIAVIFRKQLKLLIEGLFGQIGGNANSAINGE